MSVAKSSPLSREPRGHTAFWIDDRVIDQYGPLLERFPFGADALAVYAVLARRAGRDGESWERIKPMARLAATKERTFQRCIRLLELLGLVAVESCFFEGTNIRTSNRYTLLTPPPDPPDVDPDPARWPTPERPVAFVSRGVNRRHVTDARPPQPSADSPPRPASLSGSPVGCRPDTPPGVRATPTPRRADTTPGVVLTPYEGTSTEVSTGKNSPDSILGKNRDGSTSKQTARDSSSLPTHRPTDVPSFVFPESGLTNRQVWAATLGELARRGELSRAELESWLRPAALVGRDGATLVIGAPNGVTRERIATRFLPAVREALAATIGAPVGVSVVVVGVEAKNGG